MRLFRMIDKWMLLHWPRYRLRRICKAIGIKPYWWQREFALGTFDYIPPEIGEYRGVGNTTAVMLRILMIPENNVAAWAEAGRILQCDPDWQQDCIRWYSGEYRRLKNRCLAAGIPVLQVEIYRMIRSFNDEERRAHV